MHSVAHKRELSVNNLTVAGQAGLIATSATSSISSFAYFETWINEHYYILGLTIAFCSLVVSAIIGIVGLIMRRLELKKRLNISHLSREEVEALEKFMERLETEPDTSI